MKRQNLYIPLMPQDIKNFTNNVSNSREYALLLMTVCRLVLNNSEMICHSNKVLNFEYIKISEGRRSRCYIYISKDKYISFVFPFRYSSNYFWYRDLKIGPKEISEIFTILNQMNDECRLFSLFYDNGNNGFPIDENMFKIVENIITCEPGYVRHDNDPQNKKGFIHPGHHLDINYSSDATFKLGSYHMLPKEAYESIFDRDSDCFYMDRHNATKLQNIAKGFKKRQRSKHKRQN